jgi:PAS domain S-box-containing protein
MGDVRYVPYYEAVRDAPDPGEAIRVLDDDGVIAALAAASRAKDPYLANVLATEAQNRMRRARTISATLGEGVFALDMHGRVAFVNAAAERTLGWSREELLGHDLHSRIHFDLAPDECPILGVVRTGRARARSDDRFVAQDGTRFPVDYTATPILRDGEPQGVVVVFRDVTERKRAEAALRESEARLRSVVTNAPVVVFCLDVEGVFTLSEGRGLEALGLRSGEIVGRSVFDVYRNAPRIVEGARRALAGESFAVDVEWAGRIFETSYASLHDHEGRPSGAIGVATDVTERRRLERDLRSRVAFERAVARISSHLAGALELDEAVDAALEELRAAADAARAYLFRVDTARGTMSNTHERCASGAECRRDRLQDLPLREHSWWIGRLRTGQPIRLRDLSELPEDAAAERRLLEAQDVRSLIALPLLHEGALRAFVGLDYTEAGKTWREEDESLLTVAARLLATTLARHDATTELRESELRLERLVETLVEGIVVTDVDGHIALANAAAQRILGLRRSDIVGRAFDAPDWRNLTLDGEPMPPEDLPIAVVARTRSPVRRVEHRMVRPDGTDIVLSVNASPLLAPDGRLYGVVASFDDVTKERSDEVARGRLAAIVEASVDGIIGKTLEGVVTSWNKAAERIYGYAAEEAVGRHVSFLVPPERRAEVAEVLRRARAGEATVRMETERVRKDGARIRIELSVSPVRDARGRVVAAAAVQHEIPAGGPAGGRDADPLGERTL